MMENCAVAALAYVQNSEAGREEDGIDFVGSCYVSLLYVGTALHGLRPTALRCAFVR